MLRTVSGQDRRPTIGLITANIHLGVGATLWSGVRAAAERQDVNLICFPGGEVHRTSPPSNSVYELVEPELVDGVICWASAIGLPAASRHATRLSDRFGRLPMVSLNGAIGDDHSVMLDSYAGMAAATSHLIDVHRRHRLAFIHGPTANPTIMRRFRAYADTLARHRIPLDLSLVSAPVDFRRDAGAAAMRVLLDARRLGPGRDFDAVVACSDFLAADALRVLSDRDIRVPEDVAVVGFNDSVEARLADPPLTSVSMPFAELGERAMATLLGRLGSAGTPSALPGLVIRRSCGCPGTPADRPPEEGLRLLEYQRWQAEHTARQLHELGNALLSVADVPSLTAVLERRLPELGIPNWHLALGTPARLGDEVLPRERRFSAVAEPLYARDEAFGFALFEIGPPDGALYRALADQIGAALNGIKLFGEVRAARDAAERANQIKTTLLSSVRDELRTPVEVIRSRVARALAAVEQLPDAPAGLADDLKGIAVSAQSQLGVICDLLDLSCAQIDTLDLSAELVDPRTLVENVFGVRLPRRLPLIRADRRLLSEALVTLHDIAGRSAAGDAVVTVDLAVPHLRIVVSRSYPPRSHASEPDLGLQITSRLIALHNGSLRFDTGSRGGAFHIELPLPTPSNQPPASGDPPVLLVAGAIPTEVDGLPTRQVHSGDDLSEVLSDHPDAAVVWDLDQARPQDWPAVSRLYEHRSLARTPFLVYGPASGHDLSELVASRRPAQVCGPVMVIDSDPDTADHHRRLATLACPDHSVQVAGDGTTALSMLGAERPSLLVVARTLPDMTGFDVLDRLRDARQPDLPALVLCATAPSRQDLRRAEAHGRSMLVGDGILAEAEIVAVLGRLLGSGPPASRSGLLVKRAVVYLHRHFHLQITRRQVAHAAGMSEDYLSRLFHRELGLSPWDYLSRLRIQRAKERLRDTDDSVQAVARRVGFPDRAYFSRIFRRLTGQPPQAYRNRIRSGASSREAG